MNAEHRYLRDALRNQGRAAAFEEPVELVLVLDRVHRLPEPVVRVGQQFALLDETGERCSTRSSPGPITSKISCRKTKNQIDPHAASRAAARESARAFGRPRLTAPSVLVKMRSRKAAGAAGPTIRRPGRRTGLLQARDDAERHP